MMWKKVHIMQGDDWGQSNVLLYYTSPVISGFPSQRASNAEIWGFLSAWTCCWTDTLLVIWDPTALMWCPSCSLWYYCPISFEIWQLTSSAAAVYSYLWVFSIVSADNQSLLMFSICMVYVQNWRFTVPKIKPKHHHTSYLKQKILFGLNNMIMTLCCENDKYFHKIIKINIDITTLNI